MQVLSKTLRDLRDGRYKTETDPFHVLVYKDNTITSPERVERASPKRVHLVRLVFSASAITREHLKMKLQS